MLRNLFLIITISFASANLLIAQSDGCTYATVLTPQTTCTYATETHGTTVGSTQTIPAGSCGGTSDDDVWYQFIATSTSHTISVSSDPGMDAVIDLYSGSCSVLSHLSCSDATATGGTETITYTGFTSGQTYRVRVYSWGSGVSAQGGFDICVSQGPIAPSNNNCASAQTLSVNPTCSYTNSTTDGATPSGVTGCTGNADDDVWFKFIATNSVQDITSESTNSSLLDIVMNIYSGPCSSLSLLSCIDATYMGGVESAHLVGLTAGQTYYIQLYDYYSNYGGDFKICVKGAPTAAPSNDEPCSAIQIPVVTSECQYLQFTNVGATTTTSAPQPYSCNGYVSDPTGGFGSYSPKDVWFKITVPLSGSITINHDPNITGAPGEISDGVMALYSGTCGSLTQISCSENYNYPGSTHDLEPMVNENGLTPGSTVYLRYWGWGNEVGEFGFCVSTATNDDCADALYICDLNGYKGSTSPAYTPDRPGTHYPGGSLPNQMYGNNETPAGVNQPNGQNTGGPFGYYPPSNVPGPYSSPSLDVNIENNSWIRFTASAATVVLNVGISDCFVGFYPSGGIQMQIFSSSGCTDFTPVSDFKENSTGFTITANGLTVGNDYLLMIDGYAGDICNYSISANTGVKFPDIPEPTPICPGESVTLTAPPGATSYEWQHNGSTLQSVTVNPSTTTTYQCVVTGLCGHRQTLDVKVQVKPTPLIEVTEKNPSVCLGGSITLHATGADQYSFNNGPYSNTSTFTVSPTTATTYNIKGKLTSGCEATKDITVNINSLPNVVASADASICFGKSTSISASGATSYSWNNGLGNGNPKSVSPTSTATYTVTGTDGNGCTNTDQVIVTVNTLPAVVASADASVCTGQSTSISATGASTYSWNNGLGVGNPKTVSPTSPTTYTVTGTDGNGCKNTDQVHIAVNPLPNVTASTTNGTICNGTSTTISASNASSYTWNHGLGAGNPKTVSPSSNTTYTVTGTDANGCSNTAQVSIIVNELPVINASGISTTDSDCGASTGAISGVSVTAPTSGYTVQWKNGSNVLVSSILNPSGLPAGSYTLTISKNGCSTDFGPVNIINPNAPSPPDITVSSNGICEDGTVSFTINSPQSGVDYNWSGPGGFTSTATFFNIVPFTPADEGNYCVTLTESGCQSLPSCEAISILPPPNIGIDLNASDSSACEGGEANITATGGDTYSWTGPNSYSDVGNSIQIDPFTSNEEGYYIVTGTDANGCTNKDSIQVIVINNPTLSINSDEATGVYCNGGSANLTASGANNYTWTGPNNSSFSGANITIDPLNNSNSGWYIVVGTDNNQCSTTDSIQITSSSPAIDAGLNGDGVICPGDPIQFNASDGDYTYAWSGPNGDITTDQNFSILSAQADDSGWYYITITDTNSCVATDSVHVTIAINPDCLKIPTLITPNLDGKNDTWTIIGLENFPGVSVQIFNRWGSLIFEENPFKNNWGGEVNHGVTIDGGGKVPSGTYFYILDLHDKDNTPPYKGTLEVEYKKP